ncbi:hypothetical protein MFIFM68171_03643 [Madurella fahalii]|uniref:CENP-V/GFA domain-containing protein n=1 Tax=Madurella fahalii TaxID=1157608 RepID=A0ABQ0G6N8_9PEZI
MNGDGKEPVKVWLGGRNVNGEVAPGVQWNLPRHEVNLKGADGKKGNVPARCHCGVVGFVFRVGEAQREFEEKQRKGEELLWFIDLVTHKVLGSFDACNFCRIWAGSEVINLTSALLKHISFAGTDPDRFPWDTSQLRSAVEAKDRDRRFSTLALYASSPYIQRYFCSRCSACVFYAVDERPNMGNAAVGLLDAPDGAKVESVASWLFRRYMSFREDMVDTWRENLLLVVEREGERWRIERGYPEG